MRNSLNSTAPHVGLDKIKNISCQCGAKMLSTYAEFRLYSSINLRDKCDHRALGRDLHHLERASGSQRVRWGWWQIAHSRLSETGDAARFAGSAPGGGGQDDVCVSLDGGSSSVFGRSIGGRHTMTTLLLSICTIRSDCLFKQESGDILSGQPRTDPTMTCPVAIAMFILDWGK
ncbi:hypothetical protein BJX99DRAFT_162185 [Aspergillus californicus]